jgi:hypothetical protein
MATEAVLNFENIALNPAVVQWGAQNLSTVLATPDVASSLQSKWFKFYKASGVGYYVWINVGGAGIDPAPAGLLEVEVAIAANATANAIATAIRAAIALVGVFTGGSENFVVIQDAEMGTATAISQGTAPTPFTLTTVRAGFLLDIGLTEDIEMGLSVSSVEVKASQFGATILDRIRNGMNIDSITISMKEVVAAKIKSIMQSHFPAYTPAGGSQVQGIGNSLDFTNISASGGKLVLHPKKLAAAVLTEDWAFFNACPLLTGLNFSGESEQMMEVEFQILPNKWMVQEVQHGVYGDHAQNFLKVG